jgi:hypothetical protein
MSGRFSHHVSDISEVPYGNSRPQRQSADSLSPSSSVQQKLCAFYEPKIDSYEYRDHLVICNRHREFSTSTSLRNRWNSFSLDTDDEFSPNYQSSIKINNIDKPSNNFEINTSRSTSQVKFLSVNSLGNHPFDNNRKSRGMNRIIYQKIQSMPVHATPHQDLAMITEKLKIQTCPHIFYR